MLFRNHKYLKMFMAVIFILTNLGELKNSYAQSIQNNFIFKKLMLPPWSSTKFTPEQSQRIVVLDEMGGAIVVSESGGLYIQKINRYGDVIWSEPDCMAPLVSVIPARAYYDPVMTSDGHGGVFIVYAVSENKYNENNHWEQNDVYVQHIQNNFVRSWGDVGVAVAANDSIVYEWPYGIVSDGEGGVIILFSGPKVVEHPYGTIYIQRISENGEKLWTIPGKVVISPDTLGVNTLISDGAGGAFLLGGGKYIQHVNNNGQFLWPLPYVSPGLGGVSPIWCFKNNANNTILLVGANKAQKILFDDGSLLWGENGKVWDYPAIEQTNPIVTRNGKGGALLFYNHLMQELSENGNFIYDNPIIVLNTSQIKNNPIPISGEYSSQNDAAFILFLSSDSIGNQIILQKINKNGELPWGLTGITLCNIADYLTASKSIIKIDDSVNEAFVFVGLKGICVTKVNLKTGLCITSIKKKTEKIPVNFQISAYPNPFSVSTSITASKLKLSYLETTVKIYDILGREVIDLSNQLKNSSYNQILWTGVDLQNQSVAPGIYFVRVKQGNCLKVQKIIKVQ